MNIINDIGNMKTHNVHPLTPLAGFFEGGAGSPSLGSTG